MVLDHMGYDGYGNVTTESAPASGDRYKYTAREFDSATGLQYNRARYYDARIGRWIEEDPMAFGAGDVNLYRYVSNGPVWSIDPTGLEEYTDVDGHVYKVTRGKEEGPFDVPEQFNGEGGGVGNQTKDMAFILDSPTISVGALRAAYDAIPAFRREKIVGTTYFSTYLCYKGKPFFRVDWTAVAEWDFGHDIKYTSAKINYVNHWSTDAISSLPDASDQMFTLQDQFPNHPSWEFPPIRR
jgi:RHS repeat-associated protein